MSWISNLEAVNNFSAYGFFKPSKFLDTDCEEDLSRVRLQRFTNVINGMSYVLGPVIAVVRLIAVVVLALQIRNYEFQGRTEIAAANKYVRGMALRALGDLVGPLAAIVDGIATHQKFQADGEIYCID